MDIHKKLNKIGNEIRPSKMDITSKKSKEVKNGVPLLYILHNKCLNIIHYNI